VPAKRGKALRAFIYSKEEEPVLSHSVAFLLRLATSIEPEFQQLRAAKRLDDYYIPTRYPNGLPGDTPSDYYDDQEEVERALELAQTIVGLSEKKI
jgi:HEPN domain-containing protein